MYVILTGNVWYVNRYSIASHMGSIVFKKIKIKFKINKNKIITNYKQL